MASTGRALSRLSRAFARAHVARGAAPGAAPGVPGARPLAWTLTRFESSNAAARARKLEDEQVRAAGAALDAIKPGGETARSGLGDGTTPFPAKTLDGGVGPNANDANAPADAAARNEFELESAPGGPMNAGGSFPFQNQNAHHDYPSSVVYVDTLAMVRALERAGMDARVAEGVARESRRDEKRHGPVGEPRRV